MILLRLLPLVALWGALPCHAAPPVTQTSQPAAQLLSAPGSTPAFFDRAEGSVIYFQAASNGQTPKPLKTPYFDLKFLKILTPENPTTNNPYVIFSAKPCENCQLETAIYIMRVNGGSAKPMQFVYPGRMIDPKNKQTLSDSRAFYGRCLSGKGFGNGEGYVAFQQERIDRKSSLQPSVFFAEVGNDFVHERLIEKSLPKLAGTLKLVKAKVCFEIPGHNRVMLNKPLDLTPRRGGAAEDDLEDEDEPKENQTTDELPPRQE